MVAQATEKRARSVGVPSPHGAHSQHRVGDSAARMYMGSMCRGESAVMWCLKGVMMAQAKEDRARLVGGAFPHCAHAGPHSHRVVKLAARVYMGRLCRGK